MRRQALCLSGYLSQNGTQMSGIDSWSNRRVLVTGAGGFIGSHVVERLVEAGAQVRALVRYNSRNDHGWLETLDAAIVSETEVYPGDLANPEAVAAAATDRQTVLHLGALIPIPYSYRHPREFVTANVEGTLNVLEAARRHSIERVVHTSTSEVYGTPQTVPIAETHPLHPQSPYAATKVAADQLALSYHRSFGLPVVVARPFNTFGPRQSARAVIPTILSQALAGDRVELGATHPTRDFVYVQDTVFGLLRCGEVSGIEGEVINLGTGKEISIGELATRIIALADVDPELVFSSPERLRPETSEVERLLADPSRARRLLGWSAQTDFDDGLRQTLDWLRGAIEYYKPSIYNV